MCSRNYEDLGAFDGTGYQGGDGWAPARARGPARPTGDSPAPMGTQSVGRRPTGTGPAATGVSGDT